MWNHSLAGLRKTQEVHSSLERRTGKLESSSVHVAIAFFIPKPASKKE